MSWLSTGRICNIWGTTKCILSGQVEINHNTLCPSRLSKGSVSDVSRTAKGVKLKLSGYVEGGVDLNQMTVRAARLPKEPMCNISGTAAGIKLKL